jgi:thioredoxin reductase (NADPH)
MKDILIIGAGPAGMTAAVYAGRSGMDTLVLEKNLSGGQLWLTENIENYPGFPDGIKTADLAAKMENQAKKFGARILNDEAAGIEAAGEDFIIETGSGEKIEARSVILASGASMSRLGVKGEEEFLGRGVSFCAVCDGPLFREKQVAVVGGGNTACEEAVFLTRFASKVYLVHKRPKLRAVKKIRETVTANQKIELLLEKEIEEIIGKEYVEAIKMKDSGQTKVDGVFIFAGLNPNTGFIQGLVDTEKGFIKTDRNMGSSRQGIFACGDCRYGSLRQVVAACGEGAAAGEEARKYVEKKKGIAYDW